MSDTSNPENQVTIEANLTGNAAQQAAELSAQIVNLSQHLATLSQRAVQNANVTKAFNQSMGLGEKGVSQYSRGITQSLGPLGRMTRAVEMQKRVLDQATKSAEAYSAAQRMLNKGAFDPGALTRSNAAMSQSVSHMKAMGSSSNDLQKAMKQVSLIDYSRRIGMSAAENQRAAYTFNRNFSMPLILGLREAFFSYSKLATESNRTTKLILDNFNQIGASGDFEGQVREARKFTAELGKDLDKITRDWGTSRVLIQSLAGDFAELGISSRIVLGDLTRMTAETEKLGNLDISQSSEFIQTMYQTILRIRRETGKSVNINSDQVANEVISQLRGQLSVFNMIENKTVMSLRNIADAFPEVTAAATSFGLSMTEAMALVIPMIGAGFQVGASANSVKVSLQRMVAMTKQNTQIINQLNAEMGTGFKYSAGVGMENIQMLTDAYRTLSKSVSEGGKGKQGALEFFSRLFGVRQGPRMETAFAQLAAFQTSLETYGTAERKTADILQNSINAELAVIGVKKIAINQFLDLSEIHRKAIEKDSNDVLTAQALAIQKGQKKAQALLESANAKNSDFISGMSTEVGKALMAQAFDVNSLAGKQFEAELKLSQDTPEVRYRRAKESLMAIGRAIVPVVDLLMKGLLPALEKIATFLQENPFAAKLMSALLGIVALSGPVRMFFTTMQIAFGSAVGLFVKLSRIISGTTVQFASLQDLIMNPNLLRGQERVVQYLDGFLIKSKRGARELREAYDFSGISLPAKEAIEAGGIYGSEKAVNMKRMQPFVPQTNRFIEDMKTMNAQSSAQMAVKVADASESGVTKGTKNLSDDLQRMFSTVMHRFQGPNLFAGPNYFEGNIPFGGTSGGPGSTRAPRAPRGSDDLTPEQTAAAIAANEARKARLKPLPFTTYPPGVSRFFTPQFAQADVRNLAIPSAPGSVVPGLANALGLRRQKMSGMFAPSQSAKLAGVLGKGPLALGAGLPYITGEKIIEMFSEAGVELESQMVHALSNMPYFNVSPKTLEGLGKVIKSKKGLFNLALTDSGVDERMKGRFISMVSNIKWGSKKKGFIASSIEKELMPIFDFINADIGKQVMLQIGGALNTIPVQAIEELKDIKSYLTPMGSKANVLRMMKKRVTIDKVKQYQPVLVSEFNKAMEELFISIEDSSGAVIQTAQGGVLNHIMATQSEFPDVASQGLTMHPKTGRIATGSTSKYGDAAAKFLQDIQDGVVKVQTGVDSLGRETVQIIEIGSRNIAGVADAVESVSDDSPASIDFDKSVKEADKAAKEAVLSAKRKADQAAKDAAKAAKAGLPMPNYVLNNKVEKARAEIKTLKDAKAQSVLRNATILEQGGLPLPNTEAELRGVLEVMDEALVEHQQELLIAKKEFQNVLAEADRIIIEEVALQSTPAGKDRIQKAGLARLKELKAEHAIDLKHMKRYEQGLISRRSLAIEKSPAGIQRQIDRLIQNLPSDVRGAVQEIENRIQDEVNNLAVAAEKRTERLKRGLSRLRYRKGIESIETRTIKDPKWEKLFRSYRDIPMSAQAVGDNFMPDVFRSSGSRFFTDPRFSQRNATVFNTPKRLSLKSIFTRPLGVGANLATTGKDIATQFADNLEAALNGILKSSNTEVNKITSAIRKIVTHNASGTGTRTVAKSTAAFLQNAIVLTEAEISTAMQATVKDIVATFRAQTAGGLAGPGTKSQSPKSLAGFFERLRLGLSGKNAKGEKTGIVGITEAFFGKSFKAKNLNLGLDSATGVENNLKVLFANVMKSSVVGLGSGEEALSDVDTGNRLAGDILKPGRERRRATDAGIPGRKKRVRNSIRNAGREALEQVEEVLDDVNQPLIDLRTSLASKLQDLLNQQQAAAAAVSQSIPSGKEIGETLSAPIIEAQGEIKDAVNSAVDSVDVTPVVPDGKPAKKITQKAQKAIDKAAEELKEALSEIDATTNRASEILGVKPSSVNKENAGARIKFLSDRVAQEEKSLAEAVAAAQATHPNLTPGKINNLSSVKAPKKRLELFKKELEDLEKYINQSLLVEQEKARLLKEKAQKPPKAIKPTGTTSAGAPLPPPPRVLLPPPVIPAPATPSASGGAGKIFNIDKIGHRFQGPNIFSDNIFSSNLKDIVPNFDELMSAPVAESGATLAAAGQAAGAALTEGAAAVQAAASSAASSAAVGSGTGNQSLLSRMKGRLFGSKNKLKLTGESGDALNIIENKMGSQLIKKGLKLDFNTEGAVTGVRKISQFGRVTQIELEKANSILSRKLIGNFSRLQTILGKTTFKVWLFALTGGLSALIGPARKALKAIKDISSSGNYGISGAKKAINEMNQLRAGQGKKEANIVRKTTAAIGGFFDGGIAKAGSKLLDLFTKIATTVLLVGSALLIVLPIIAILVGFFGAWKSASGRLDSSMQNLKDAFAAIKEAVAALFAPIRDVINQFTGGNKVLGQFATEGEKNAALFYSITGFIKKTAEAIKNWAKTTGAAFMKNTIAPQLVRIINKFILLGSAIKDFSSGKTESGMKKIKAIMWSFYYDVINIIKQLVDGIINVSITLTPVFGEIAKGILSIFAQMFVALVQLAAAAGKDMANGLVNGVAASVLEIPTLGFSNPVSNSVRNSKNDNFNFGEKTAPKGMTLVEARDALKSGKSDEKTAAGSSSGSASDKVKEDFATNVDKGISDLLPKIKSIFDTVMVGQLDMASKKYFELVGKGINVPLSQALKDPKAYKDALAFNAKKSADAATASGESLGSKIASGMKDKMKEIKDTLKGYFYSNVDAKFDSIIQQYTDALEKQKDQQLKAYDDQIAGIDALADAEARLTAKKDYETKRREMIDQRETDRGNYLIERRLAVYEGRVLDVRKLDREEVLAQRNSTQEIEGLDSDRLSQLQSEQRDLAKQAISNQKDLAEKQFQEVLDTFDRFIEDVKNKSFSTQEEFAAALKKVGDQTNVSSAELSKVFAKNIGELPGIIAGVRDPSIQMFSANMNDLIKEASKKFGVDNKIANPSTVLGAVRMMAIGSEEGFKAAFNPVFATTYVQPTVDAIGKITSSLSEKGNKNNIAEIWQKAGEDAFAKLKNELNRDIQFPKILESFKNLLAEIRPLVNQIVTEAAKAAAAMEGIGGKPEIADLPQSTLDEWTKMATGMMQTGQANPAQRAAMAASAARIVSVIASNLLRGVVGIKAILPTSGLTPFEQGWAIKIMAGINLPGTTVDLSGGSGPLLPKMYNGGSIGHYGRGGFLEAPASQGIPALLHGGEYIINHKAVERFGKGNLEKINALRHGGDLKGFASGGYMTTPGFANGGYMTTPGFARGGNVRRKPKGSDPINPSDDSSLKTFTNKYGKSYTVPNINIRSGKATGTTMHMLDWAAIARAEAGPEWMNSLGTVTRTSRGVFVGPLMISRKVWETYSDAYKRQTGIDVGNFNNPNNIPSWENQVNVAEMVAFKGISDSPYEYYRKPKFLDGFESVRKNRVYFKPLNDLKEFDKAPGFANGGYMTTPGFAKGGSVRKYGVEDQKAILALRKPQPLQGPYATSIPVLTKRNIDLNTLPQVANKNGGMSTIGSVGFGLTNKSTGPNLLLPSVFNNQIDYSKNLSPTINEFMKTGRHLGVYPGLNASTLAASVLHLSEQNRIGKTPTAKKGYTPEQIKAALAATPGFVATPLPQSIPKTPGVATLGKSYSAAELKNLSLRPNTFAIPQPSFTSDGQEYFTIGTRASATNYTNIKKNNAMPVKKEGLSWWKEILRPKNSFAVAGALLAGFLGSPTGPGAVATAAGGAAVGGGIGEWVEQLFDSEEGFQPLDILKNAALQGTFDLVGGLLIKNVASPFFRAKFPGLLSGVTAQTMELPFVKPWIYPLINRFKKPLVDEFGNPLIKRVTGDIIETTLAKPRIELPPSSVKPPRVFPVTERGNAPTIIDAFRGAGGKFDRQVLDLLDEMDALVLGQTETLATVTRREILRTQLQLRGTIPKVMQSPEELAFYNNMLNDLLGIFYNNAKGVGRMDPDLITTVFDDIGGGFAEDLGVLTLPTLGNIDPRILPGSREVFDFQFQQIKIAEQIGDLLRDSDGVIPPDLRSSVTAALGLKPSSGQFLESTPWLHLPRQNQSLYRNEWMDSLYDEAQLAANALKDQMAFAPKQLTAGTKGGALVRIPPPPKMRVPSLEELSGIKPGALAIPDVKYLPIDPYTGLKPIGNTRFSNTAFLNSLNNPIEIVSEFVRGIVQGSKEFRWTGRYFQGFDAYGINPAEAPLATGFNVEIPRKSFPGLPKNTELIHATPYAIFDAAHGFGGLDRTFVSEFTPTAESFEFVRKYALAQSIAAQSMYEFESRRIYEAIRSGSGLDFYRNFMKDRGVDLDNLDYRSFIEDAFTPEQVDMISYNALKGQPAALEIFERMVEKAKDQILRIRATQAKEMAALKIGPHMSGLNLENLTFVRELSNAYDSFFNPITGAVEIRTPGSLNDFFVGSGKQIDPTHMEAPSGQLPVFRDTIHGALNNIAPDAGMFARKVQPNAQYIAAPLKEIMDANPGNILANLFAEDTQLVPIPFRGIVFPNVKNALEPGFDLPRYFTEIQEFGAGMNPDYIAAARAKIQELRYGPDGYGYYDFTPQVADEPLIFDPSMLKARVNPFRRDSMYAPDMLVEMYSEQMDQYLDSLLEALYNYQKFAKEEMFINDIFNFKPSILYPGGAPKLNYSMGNPKLDGILDSIRYSNNFSAAYDPTAGMYPGIYGGTQYYPSKSAYNLDMAEHLRGQLENQFTWLTNNTDDFLSEGKFGYGASPIKYAGAGYSETKNLVRQILLKQGKYGIAYMGEHGSTMGGESTALRLGQIAFDNNALSALHSATWYAPTGTLNLEGAEDGVVQMLDLAGVLKNNLLLRYYSTDNQFIQNYPGIFPGRFTRLTKIDERGYNPPPPPEPGSTQIDLKTGEPIGIGVRAPVSNKKAAVAAGFALGGFVPNLTMPRFEQGGFLEAPASQGIPAMLHGGEYIINHKAVERFGKGNLEKINALRNGGYLKGFASGGYMTTPGFEQGGFIGPMLPKKKNSFWGKVGKAAKGALTGGGLDFVKELLRPKNSFAIVGGIIGGILGATGGPAGAVGGVIGGSAAGGGIGSFVEQLFDKKKGFQPMDIGKNMLVQGALGALGLGVGAVAKRFVMPALAKYAKPGLSKAASLLGKVMGKASPYVDDVFKGGLAEQDYLLHHSLNDIKIGDFVRQRLVGSNQVTAGDALPGYSYAWDAQTGVNDAVKNQVSGRISRFLPNGLPNFSVPEQFQDFFVHLTRAQKSKIYPDLNVPGSSARSVASAQEVIDSIKIPAIISNDEAEMFVRNMLIKNNVPFNLNSELSREINKKFLFSKGSEALKDFHKGQFDEYATRVFRNFDKGAPAWANGVLGKDAKLAHDLYLSGDIEKAKELLYGSFLRVAAGQKVSGLKNLLTIKQLTTGIPRFEKGGYLKFKEGGEVPSILHGGEYVLNSAAVKKYGLAHLEAMNQMKFNVPSAGFSVPQASYSGNMAGGMTTSTQNVNIYVDNFIGEPEWFNSMMKDYNTKILPKNQKAAGLENRVISTYNGLNRGQ